MDSLYHVWFSTKGRSPVLVGVVGEDIRRLVVGIARRKGIRLLEVQMALDHVHIVVALSVGQNLPSAMHQIKGSSARSIFLRYPELKLDMGHNAFWQKGYGFRKLSPSELARVRGYVRTQDERPLRH